MKYNKSHNVLSSEEEIPNSVKDIINILCQNGFEAFAVGGCVRDIILGRVPNDWDITTSAKPEDVKELFEKTIDTGLKHGTVTVLIDSEPYEVTTYRIDGTYLDHRRPESVEYTSNLVEDLKRRDFTINAMAMSSNKEVIDEFNGLKDLENKIIRCVGDPNERFEEDALRMLRAIRFSAQLGFEIHSETIKAIKNKAHLIKEVSGERIRDELNKILISNNPMYIANLYNYGLMEYIIPEFIININLDQQNPYHVYTVDEHIYRSLNYVRPTISLRWTMFLHDIGKGYCKTVDEKGIGHFYGHPEKSVELAKTILKRLKFDNKTKDEIIRLIKNHDYHINDPNLKKVRRAVYKIGKDIFSKYIEVMKADIMAQNPKLLDKRIIKLEAIKEYFNYIIKENQCTTIKELAINGNDLIKVGISEGKKIGLILSRLLEIVIEDPDKNDKEFLIKKALEIK